MTAVNKIFNNAVVSSSVSFNNISMLAVITAGLFVLLCLKLSVIVFIGFTAVLLLHERLCF